MLSSLFKLKEFREAKEFLSIQIIRIRERNQIFLHQQPFTDRIIERFCYSDLHPVSTPWNHQIQLPASWEKLTESSQLYSQQTGSTNYLSCYTRPDITFTSNRLASANSGPSPIHWTALKHLFRYLVRTCDLGIVLGSKYDPFDIDLKVYYDTAFADKLVSRYSTAGHVILVAGGPIY